MWFLKNITNDQCFYMLHAKAQYTVGRIGADLVLKDTSVSRMHANLHLVTLPTGTASLELEDVGSKFGTYRNDGLDTKTKLPAKSERVRLHPGDRTRFGLLTSVFTVGHQVIVSLAPSLSESETQEFQRCHRALGIKVLDEWLEGDGCATHFTISEEKRFTPTTRVLHALLNDLALVRCDYWRDLLTACQTGSATLPPVDAYKPQAWLKHAEFEIRDCRAAERRRLFRGLTFVFVHRKNYDVYLPIVQKAGGTCRFALSVAFQALPKTFVLQADVITIEYIPDTQTQSSQTVTDLLNYLKKHSRRLIPEYEIGLAILACSTAKHCNPSYTIAEDLLPCPDSQCPTEDFPTADADSEYPKANDALLSMFPSTIPESAVGEEAPRSPCSPGSPLVGKRKKCQRLGQSSDEDDLPESEHRFLHKSKKRASEAPPKSRRLSFVEDSDLELESDGASENLAAEPQRQGKRKSCIYDSDDDADSSSDAMPLAKKPHSQPSQNPCEELDPRAPTVSVFGEGNDDDDDDLFLLAEEVKEKRTTASVAAKSPKAKALPVVIESAASRQAKGGRGTKDTTGFLEKSQRPQAGVSSQLNRSGAQSGRLDESGAKALEKRPVRIPVLGEDDDDDSGDDLFSFGKASPIRLTQSMGGDQFDFRESSGKPQHVETPTKSKPPQPVQATTMPEAKPQPKTLNVSGWLSCGLQAVKIEKFDEDAEVEGVAEQTVRVKAEPTDDDDEDEWVSNLKPMNVLWRPKEEEEDEEVPTARPKTAGRNFKRFVKKGPGSLCPPPGAKRLVKTVSEIVNDDEYM